MAPVVFPDEQLTLPDLDIKRDISFYPLSITSASGFINWFNTLTDTEYAQAT